MSTNYIQPIIRGIQAVGSVQLKYFYNTTSGDLPIPNCMKFGSISGDAAKIATANGIQIAGFRLDSEFLRANPQIASSFVIPILGGGGVALTNNNRTGTLNLVCTKVSTPNTTAGAAPEMLASMHTPTGSAIGVKRGTKNATTPYYDMVTIAQIQQGQDGGDSVGSTILIGFEFCEQLTLLQFEGCTIATVDPIGLAGNDAVNYNIVINYLNWQVSYGATSVSKIV